MQFPQIRRARKPRDIARTDVQHPLRGFDGGVIVAQFRVGVGQIPVYGDVVWNTLIQGGSSFQSLGEFVAAE